MGDPFSIQQELPDSHLLNHINHDMELYSVLVQLSVINNQFNYQYLELQNTTAFISK